MVASFEAGLAVEGATVQAGAYQAIAPTLAWSRGRYSLRAVVPAYHIERYGYEDTGLGDVILSGHVQLAHGHAWALGVIAAVGVPTGNAGDGLGMGHLMVMPSLFVAVQRGRAAITVHAGLGKSLADADDHAGHRSSIVSPMNPFEVGTALRVSLGVTPRLALQAAAGLAVPFGDGVTRSTASAGTRYRVGATDVGFELHLPIAGDPFRARLVADVAHRF